MHLLEIVLLAWRYAWHGLCYRVVSVCHMSRMLGLRDRLPKF